MNPTVRHFPSRGYVTVPWRNGAGTTREIVRHPAQGEPFAWRMSLASVDRDAPFSAFPGYQRLVALADGPGFSLDIAGMGAATLAERGAHVLFSGAVATTCRLLDGPCTDLSLMVHQPGRIESVRLVHLESEERLRTQSGRIQVLFVLNGSAQSETPGELVAGLQRHDTLVIEAAKQHETQLRSQARADLLALTFLPPSGQ